MAKAYRWAYMANPNYNPPNDECPECLEPSRTYHIGSRSEGDFVIHTWKCQHQHEWVVTEQRAGSQTTGEEK